MHWVVARRNLHKYANGFTGLIGGENEIIRISRQHPKLDLSNWEILMLPKHEYGCLVPFPIDRGESTHPTELLEPKCKLRSVRVTTPDLPNIMKICSWLGLNADFAEADDPKLEFCIDTPNAEVTLATPHPLPGGVSFR